MTREKDDRLEALNCELKAIKAGVTVRRRGDRLSLRATLPPKPGSDRREAHQQDISLGIYANPAGYKRAKAAAMQLSSSLAMKSFRWEDWLEPEAAPKSEQTIARWITAFEEHYFSSRQRSPKTETTWQRDYIVAMRKLDHDALLTEGEMLRAIASTKPDTKTRKRVCMVLSALAKFAKIELDIVGLAGNYSPKAVQPRDLPSDALIEEWRDRIEDPGWQWVFGMMAAYGLRNHEVFLLDYDSVRSSPGLTVLDGKTGGGRVYPYHAHWYKDWQLHDVTLPKTYAEPKDHAALGIRVTQFFSYNKIPFKPYDLRHAWALRTAVAGLDPAIAAKMMRHTLQVHSDTYHQFLNDSHMLAAWEASTQPKM